MSFLPKLLKVGSLSESIGVYLPITAFQKALGMGRLVLFLHLMAGMEGKIQYGLWAVGAMIFDIAAPLVCLGSNHGMGRYVSYYESRGQLHQFYRRVRWGVLGLCTVLVIVAVGGSDWIRQLAIDTREGVVDHVSHSAQLLICWAALANVLMMALYLNLLSFLYGMRVYRLVSLVELAFSVIFTILGAAVLFQAPTGLALLVAHCASVALTIILGVALLEIGFRSQASWRTEPPLDVRKSVVLESPAEVDEISTAVAMPAGVSAQDQTAGSLGKILQFGLVAMISNVLWGALAYVSFSLVRWWHGFAAEGTFQAYLRLDQQVVFLANAAWAVVFSYVARRWEGHQKPAAMFTLETSYKAIAMATMTLSMLLYLTVPWWVCLLPAEHRDGIVAVGGLLMFFQVLTHLSILHIMAKLRERPSVLVVAAVASIAGNLLLAVWWMRGASGDVEAMRAGALAAAVGVYAGGGLVTVIYFLIARIRIHASTWLIFAVPVLLLLPAWLAAVLWAVLCAAAIWTPWIFDRRQKRELVYAVGVIISWWKRVLSGR